VFSKPLDHVIALEKFRLFSVFTIFVRGNLKNLRTDSVFLRPEGRGQRGVDEFLGWTFQSHLCLCGEIVEI
jgi:hypothetical protein